MTYEVCTHFWLKNHLIAEFCTKFWLKKPSICWILHQYLTSISIQRSFVDTLWFKEPNRFSIWMNMIILNNIKRMKCPLSLLQMPVKTFHESSDQPNSQFSRTFWQGLCWFLVKNKFGSLAFCYRHPKYALTLGLGRHKKITSAMARGTG